MLKLATIWLGGCSGCHMSLLDLDEWLIDLAGQVELVFGPLVDYKQFPAGVDLTLVEGAVANEDNLALVRTARANSRILVSLGDCAVTGNVTALRNPLGEPANLVRQIYLERGDHGAALPDDPIGAPRLLSRVLPVHAVVPVEHYLPGCPPSAPRIRAVLEALLAGEMPALTGREMLRFG